MGKTDAQKMEASWPRSQPPDETELGSEPGPLSHVQTSFHTGDGTQVNILFFFGWGDGEGHCRGEKDFP